MTDLVKRLRAMTVPNLQIADDVIRIEALSLMLNEATARIEALEAALRLAIEELGWGEMEQTRNRLRAALAPEQDK